MVETTNLATQRSAEGSGERSAHEIRQDIVAERETITETVDKLGDRLQQTFDWREYVSDYPAVALGVAAGAGILLSAIFKREPTPQERIMDAVADLTEDLTGRISGVAGDLIARKVIPSRTVKTAVTAMIAKVAIEFARRKIADAVNDQRVERLDISRRTSEALSSL